MKRGLRFGGIGLMAVGAVLVVVYFFSGSKAPVGEVTRKVYVKEKVISGAYKTYALKDIPVPMWLAKTVFQNKTDQRINSLKVRYKVSEYSDWCSWHNYAAVDPGQTVVDPYYPIFTSACAKLTSRAPSELLMEFEYLDEVGQKHHGVENRALTMLDRHEFIFSDLTAGERTAAFQDVVTYGHLLAAWVSRSDEVVARLASMANKKAGGLGASTNDDSCIKVMAALYDIMRTIHISYQHPPALLDKNLSYDIKLVQSLQYPRDTIQKRSGTCIDLAILYAAMLNSINIEPYLVVIDGHCFPMARTPSGIMVGVEATGVGDGYEKGMSFEQAVKSATETWKKVNQSGRFVLIDVRQIWMAGISNPELDTLPPDILDRWGITALVEEPARTVSVAVQPSTPAVPSPGGVAPPQPAAPAGIAGKWNYTVTAPNGTKIGGKIQLSGQGNQYQMVATASYQLPGQDGRMHKFTEREDCVAMLNGLNFQARCDSVKTTMDGYPTPSDVPLFLNLVLDQGGRTMQGQVVNKAGVTVPIRMQKQ
ncbi:MAG: transglutaminase-like domain-containing protein [Syntrophobacteraceae bacterium]